MRRLAKPAAVAAAVLAVVLLPVLAGCDRSTPPPATVIVNTPPADGGLAVLLTVMVGVALLALAAAGVFAWCWASERRARRDAEAGQRTLLVLSGLDRAAELGQGLDVPGWPGVRVVRRELER